jgi:hypothetical protein
MEDEEVNARWQAEMVGFFELPPGDRPDTGFDRLREIFHTGGSGCHRRSSCLEERLAPP